jgi:hypothetical protein
VIRGSRHGEAIVNLWLKLCLVEGHLSKRHTDWDNSTFAGVEVHVARRNSLAMMERVVGRWGRV